MTKDQFQQELIETVTEGIKPSTIKKLKKSKSADDIQNHNPPTPLLQEQLKVKQQEVENLREQLEVKNTELNTLKKDKETLLDDNLTLKHQSLKDWFQQYQQTKKLETELAENIDYASDELVEQDKLIANLRTENSKLQQEKKTLQKDLNLAQKLAEMRKYPLPENSNSLNYWPLLTIMAFTALTLWFLNKNTE
jgi:chromosome segregation ATPase